MHFVLYHGSPGKNTVSSGFMPENQERRGAFKEGRGGRQTPPCAHTEHQSLTSHSKQTEQMNEQIKYIQKQRHCCTDIIIRTVTT